MNKYIVMTARERMPNSCWGQYGRIAVIETDGINMPTQINPRHKTVKEHGQLIKEQSAIARHNAIFT